MPESTDQPASRPSARDGAAPPSSAKNARKDGKHRRGPKTAKPRERVTPGGPRHLARITAMQVLFEVDVADHTATEVLARTFDATDLAIEDDGEDHPTADPPALPAGEHALMEIQGRVERLVRGVMENFREIDPYIAEAAPAFPIDQLPAVDRNVLRLATYELLREPDVPPRAAINEAVELAKRFGGESSGRFVNGVLGTVLAKIERERNKPAGGTTPAPAPTPSLAESSDAGVTE